jgi:hypothetical protein
MLETHVRVQAEYDQNVINEFAAVLLYESERLHPMFRIATALR